MRSWPFPFSPRDAGIYPFATGQIWGARASYIVKSSYFPFRKHIYRSGIGRKPYSLVKQTPAECSSAIILTAAYYNETGDAAFIMENADLFSKWADYLVSLGIYFEQISADDFLGIPGKNVNLAIKCVTAVALWARLLEKIRPGDGRKYSEYASAAAKELERVSDAGQHTTLAIDERKSWSLKYNLYFAALFCPGLFSESLVKKEAAFYRKKLNKYGVPLDSRTENCKSDRLMFAAALDGGINNEAFSSALAKMLSDADDRVPFTDYFNSVTGEMNAFFARGVQGAVWAEEYARKVREKGGYLF